MDEPLTPYYPPPPPTNDDDQCCDDEDWLDCMNNCMNLYQPFDAVAPFSQVPKKMVPPFRVVSVNRMTTLLSSIAHFMKKGGNKEAAAMTRGLGRLLDKIATPLTVGGGFYALGTEIFCAGICGLNAHPCSN